MIDVTGAYTHAPIDRELYVEYPDGYGKNSPTVMKLKKALYGAHQSGQLWEQYRNDKILTLGYQYCQKGVSIFTRMTKNGIYSIIICYVDDFVICCTKGHIKSVKKEILDLFDCKDLGETRLFLGISITRDRSNRTISLNMEAYIRNIVKLADLGDAAPAHTPMSHSQPILKPINESNEYPYITQLGSLFWIARCTRPDIAFAVALLARFSSCYGPSHITVIRRIHRYLLETAHIGLTYDGNKPFYEVGYSDSDFASQYGRKSITGSIVMMGGAAISWTSKRLPTVSLSTMEAEFYAVCNTAKEILSIRQFLDDLGITQDTPAASPIFCDNQAAIEAAHNPTHKTRAKHIDIAYNFIRDEIQQDRITVSFIPTRDNLADALTKPLSYNQHWFLANSFLGIHERHHSNVLGDHLPRVSYALDQRQFVSSLPEM
ncbi:hypothetical protein OPQ81_002656 [Rhizoctonia solani]|nr:hypothetical protein OPQ81_002656 [Rhizoctonia solani]